MKKFIPWVRSLLLICLVTILIFSNAGEVLARRGGGRIGGGSFRAPTRSVPAPSRGGSYGGGYGGSGYYGGGGGFFFLPFFFGGGGGGLFSILILVAIAGVVLQAFRGISGTGITGENSKVSLVKLRVGLLSSAREIQNDLSRLALEANTGDAEGLATVLRETVVSLMRHPEYWVYVNSGKETTQFALAEQKFNSLAMSERSKLSTEVLSNFNNRLVEGSKASTALPSADQSGFDDISEYIVVTLLVASTGDTLAKIPDARSASDLKQVLATIGAVPEDQLLALEVLWEPQSKDFTLSADEVISVYPELVRI